MNQSVNGWLSMKNSLQARLEEVKGMKCSAMATTIQRYDGKEVETKPVYDVKLIDKKCSQLTTALFLIDRGIKDANAKNQLELSVDYDDLVAPIA